MENWQDSDKPYAARYVGSMVSVARWYKCRTGALVICLGFRVTGALVI